MQIYGILLNIRGKSENFMEFCGIFKPKMLNLTDITKKLSFYLVEHNFFVIFASSFRQRDLLIN
jgi:hypothetical protein